ncbi:hypothetical protein Tco_1459424 [Tanacetum coccineum]
MPTTYSTLSSSRHSTLEADQINHQFWGVDNGSSPFNRYQINLKLRKSSGNTSGKSRTIGNVDNLLGTHNDRLVLRQPIHTDYSIETTKFYGQSETTFSGGGDDEGSAAENSVMPALVDGDRGLEGTGSSVGTVEGSAEARCSSSSSSSSSFLTSSSSLSSSDDSLS